MSDHDFCRSLLRDNRNSFHDKGRLKGMYVDITRTTANPYAWVRDAKGNVLWQGSTCCKWHAKSLAIDSMKESTE